MIKCSVTNKDEIIQHELEKNRYDESVRTENVGVLCDSILNRCRGKGSMYIRIYPPGSI